MYSLHVASVLQMTHMLLCHGGLLKSNAFAGSLHLASYWSAIVHDFEHEGLNNDFLIKTGHPLALLYNDQSPLENHHLAAAFKIWIDPHCQYMTVRICSNHACGHPGGVLMSRSCTHVDILPFMCMLVKTIVLFSLRTKAQRHQTYLQQTNTCTLHPGWMCTQSSVSHCSRQSGCAHCLMCMLPWLQHKSSSELVRMGRACAINQVLGTDMKKHFDIVSRFQVSQPAPLTCAPPAHRRQAMLLSNLCSTVCQAQSGSEPLSELHKCGFHLFCWHSVQVAHGMSNLLSIHHHHTSVLLCLGLAYQAQHSMPRPASCPISRSRNRDRMTCCFQETVHADSCFHLTASPTLIYSALRDAAQFHSCCKSSIA